MEKDDWVLLFHAALSQQLDKLTLAAARAKKRDPDGYEGNGNVKLLRALSKAMFETVPGDPTRESYRQGTTLGAANRHWRRIKIGRRFRLFFRYHSQAKVIVYAWVNDIHTLRNAGGRSDPYTVFERSLAQGDPPADWDDLVRRSQLAKKLH